VAGYAARDLVAFPLERFPAGGARNEPLVACDGAAETPHDGCINVLYTDGSVVVLTLEDESAAGHLAPGARALPVGPGSP
jgi:prepilin-type processing-associated H-X9-DG protein